MSPVEIKHTPDVEVIRGKARDSSMSIVGNEDYKDPLYKMLAPGKELTLNFEKPCAKIMVANDSIVTQMEKQKGPQVIISVGGENPFLLI